MNSHSILAASAVPPARTSPTLLRRFWKALRWTIALGVIGFWVWIFARQAAMRPMLHSLPFELWYGNWADVLLISAIFLTFVLGLAWPRGTAQWRNAGLCSAFLISLFVEMFGLPLTIFLLSPLINVPILAFDLGRSHLWAYVLDRSGVIPLGLGVYLVMTISMALIAIGMSLLALGWVQVFGARHELVTSGIYRFVRHPQYLGLILVLVAFNIQWPTLLTLLMAPLLIVAYIRQARREDAALAAVFGTAFLDYAVRVPAFVPVFQARA